MSLGGNTHLYLPVPLMRGKSWGAVYLSSLVRESLIYIIIREIVSICRSPSVRTLKIVSEDSPYVFDDSMAQGMPRHLSLIKYEYVIKCT